MKCIATIGCSAHIEQVPVEGNIENIDEFIYNSSQEILNLYIGGRIQEFSDFCIENNLENEDYKTQWFYYYNYLESELIYSFEEFDSNNEMHQTILKEEGDFISVY